MARLLQLFFGLSAILLAIWVTMPWLGVGALAIVVASAITAVFLQKFKKRLFALAVLAAIAIPLSYFLPKRIPYTWDFYFALLAWLVGAATFPGARAAGGSPGHALWRGFGFFWCFCGALIISMTAYDRSHLGWFYLGLFLILLLLVVLKRVARLGPFALQVANTFLLLIVGLPIADWFGRPAYRLDVSPDPEKKYYSFEGARKDPSAFRRWWPYYVKQWDAMGGKVYMRDPQGVLPFRLRPSSQGRMFNSTISINGLGFRGKEIALEKGNAYRIVAIGESTTFGATMNRDDQPWPEVLEQIIRERLKPSRPVEVINAGIPAHTLVNSLSRLAPEILPLKPDMVVCYHGYNGLHYLYGAVPPRYGQQPPPYVERPVKLFANLEYNLKMSRFKRSLAQKPRATSSAAIPLLDTPYARAYEHLIEAARTNAIRVAIGNFSMAVTTNSPRDVIEFYRAAFPSIYWSVEANAVHADLTQQLAARHPEIILVDMHPGLDGEHDKFVDLVHLTQSGRQQAAENVFAGIRKVLEEDLRTPASAVQSSSP